jgi:hypothetical protein
VECIDLIGGRIVYMEGWMMDGWVLKIMTVVGAGSAGACQMSNVVSRREYTSKPGLTARKIRDSVDPERSCGQEGRKRLAAKTIVESNLFAL